MLGASIIICTRNRVADLRETLEAIGRTCVPAGLLCELIVVDNASTDGTARLVQEYRLPNMPVRYVYEGQAGKGNAYNAGIAAARGQALLWTDDDVRPPPDWIAGMAGPILRGEADAVAGGVRIAPHLVQPWMTVTERALLASTEEIHPCAPMMIGANMAFAKAVLKHVPAFDRELGPGALGFYEESLFTWQLLKAGCRLAERLDLCVEHHPDPARISHESFLSTVTKYGRSLAYVEHHWEHRVHRAVHLRLWGRLLRLVVLRMVHRRTLSRVQAPPDWERSHTQGAAFFRQYLIERRRPRNYEQQGLVKKVF